MPRRSNPTDSRQKHATPNRAADSSQAAPVFAQPQPTPDPTGFRDPVTDQRERELRMVEPVPQARGRVVEPVLTLAQVYGSMGPAKTESIAASGQIVLHCVGDTGSAKGPETQNLVSDKMVSDFHEANPADVPSFFYHLGDVVYYFGEAAYYYDQFYEPFRDYPAPIVAIPGNHDGVVWKGDPSPSLAAFLRNFCAAAPEHSPDAGGLLRTTMIQPSVYYTMEAPFVRILGLYSNVLEDPGVISDENGQYPSLDQRQVEYLKAALARIKREKFAGAIILATHHPAFTGGTDHGGSPGMLADIDAACEAAGVWPHAVLAGHTHNYQRYSRRIGGVTIPYIVAGCGGHSPLSRMRGIYRTPYRIDDQLSLESYDDTDYGYLRIVIDAQSLRIEFHPQHDGGRTRTPDDVVTVDLETRALR